MKRNVYAAIAALVLFFVVAPGGAAPKAQSGEECALFADLALVAATHAKHGLDASRTLAMVPDMYPLDARGKELAIAIIAAAASFIERKHGKPADFAALLLRTCADRRGDMDPILGVRL